MPKPMTTVRQHTLPSGLVPRHRTIVHDYCRTTLPAGHVTLRAPSFYVNCCFVRLLINRTHSRDSARTCETTIMARRQRTIVSALAVRTSCVSLCLHEASFMCQCYRTMQHTRRQLPSPTNFLLLLIFTKTGVSVSFMGRRTRVLCTPTYDSRWTLHGDGSRLQKSIHRD